MIDSQIYFRDVYLDIFPDFYLYTIDFYFSFVVVAIKNGNIESTEFTKLYVITFSILKCIDTFSYRVLKLLT